MDQPPKHSETMAERAERWAAESAQAKPQSKVREHAGEIVPRVLFGLVLTAMVGAIVVGGWAVTHRSQPSDHQSAGWITAGTCFNDDPGTYFEEDMDFRKELPTVDCADPHLAEAFLSIGATASLTADPGRECAREWARQSDVPPEVSGIRLTYLTTGVDSIEKGALCVAVGSEPVEGRSLASWQP